MIEKILKHEFLKSKMFLHSIYYENYGESLSNEELNELTLYLFKKAKTSLTKKDKPLKEEKGFAIYNKVIPVPNRNNSKTFNINIYIAKNNNETLLAIMDL